MSKGRRQKTAEQLDAELEAVLAAKQAQQQQQQQQQQQAAAQKRAKAKGSAAAGEAPGADSPDLLPPAQSLLLALALSGAGKDAGER